jgi:hypothetical protein
LTTPDGQKYVGEILDDLPKRIGITGGVSSELVQIGPCLAYEEDCKVITGYDF